MSEPSNYSISKPTKTKEEYRKQYSSDDILVGEPEETLVIHGTDNEEYEELIRQSERQHCARIIRSFLITPWFLNENGKGYKDEERARIENERLEIIASAVEKG